MRKALIDAFSILYSGRFLGKYLITLATDNDKRSDISCGDSPFEFKSKILAWVSLTVISAVNKALITLSIEISK